MELTDTIAAIATPPGRGGIGVVRFAGPDALKIAQGMLRTRHELLAGRAIVADLVEPETGETIDQVVTTFFSRPNSYTTDDLVEISAHGSPVVLQHVMSLALQRGARLAEPGEFTMRAFLNGRIDLTQAEAVRDLIEAQTLFQAKVAAQQLQGAVSQRLKPAKQKLVELIALLEAGVDFAEDDVAVLPPERILAHIEGVTAGLRQLAAGFAYGRIVQSGLTLAIVGRPNVGKSSLFNRLVERERAIVTAAPGTTRDLVSETVALDGIPVNLVDTAGIREALDEAETLGIQKSYEALADADLVLLVLDASLPFEREDRKLADAIEGRKALMVWNKCDLPRPDSGVEATNRGIAVSALTGQGIEELRRRIRELSYGSGGMQEDGFVTNLRHQQLVTESLEALSAAESAARNAIPHEMLLLDLYNALRPLDAITGETTADDILNLIFSSFCIGK